MRIHNPTITGSLALSGSGLTINDVGTLSGSSTSTGSFGSVHTSGQTGIQTTAPKKGLTVKATGNDDGIALLASNGQYVALIHQQDSDAGMLRLYDESSTTKIAFNADDGETSYFNNGGKVGIGTSDPDTELHIHQGNAGSVGTHANYILTLEGSSDVLMQFRTPNNRDTVGIVFGDPDDQNVGRVIYDHTTDRLNLFAAGTQQLQIGNNIISGSTTSTGSFGHIESAGNFLPKTDNVVDLGSSARRWANLFVGDLVLSNEGSGGNEIDGTEGNWIVQEGEENLYLLNKKNGKKYKFKLEEVD